jgi:hypothetical protein
MKFFELQVLDFCNSAFLGIYSIDKDFTAHEIVFQLWLRTISPNVSGKFSPYGRARNVHLPRHQRLAVVYYGCALECLANERLAHVKYPGQSEISVSTITRIVYWQKQALILSTCSSK